MVLNGIYTVARGMIAAEKGKDVLASNLANSDTVGFKGQDTIIHSFPDVLMKCIDETGEKVIGLKGTGSQVIQTFTNFENGQLQKTENPLDVAIAGTGFMAVETPQGIAYTRSGHFSLNSFGELVTQDGHVVLGESGPIETNGEPFQIGEDGTVKINGVNIDRLALVDFEDLQMLERLGHNLYRAPQNIKEIEAEGMFRQGYVERSNVNVIQGMTQMITAARLYEMSQKTIQSQDETLSKAVNDVGRVG